MPVLSPEDAAIKFAHQLATAVLEERTGTLDEIGVDPQLMLLLSASPAGRLRLRRELDQRNNPDLKLLLGTQLFSEIETLRKQLAEPRDQVRGWLSLLKNSSAAIAGGAIVLLGTTEAPVGSVVLTALLGISVFGYALWNERLAQKDIVSVNDAIARLEETRRVLIE